MTLIFNYLCIRCVEIEGAVSYVSLLMHYYYFFYSYSESDIFYREVTSGDLLSRASKEVREQFPSSQEFTAKMVFIVSYHNVTYFGNNKSPPPVS